MHIQTNRYTNPLPSAVIAEDTLLELFAPSRLPERSDRHYPSQERTTLWRSDAIHRANNFAQMAGAIAYEVENHNRRLMPMSAVMDARALARAYEELGCNDGASNDWPCQALLGEIANRLILLFGQGRAISTFVDLQPLSLTADRRRALILICSELTINALKYAFLGRDHGRIVIRLTAAGGEACLIVEDDGTGKVSKQSPGQGSALLVGLATVLGATMRYADAKNGVGYRITVTFPVDDSAKIAAPEHSA